MKAIKYETQVFEGTLDWVHGGGCLIKEVFVPEKKLCFNKGHMDSLNIFSADAPRDNKQEEEVEISDELARGLGILLRATGEINKEKEILLQEIKKEKLLEECGNGS